MGVRQFGSSILHYRTWNEGSRINYTVTDEAAGEYKKGSPARFTEQTHYKIWNGQFRFNLKGLETAINLTPDERQAMEFGQKFLISSELLEAFWTDVGQQEANIQSMINTMSSALQDNTPDHVRQVFLSIFTFTQRAITNHERMIAGTISQENAEVVRYPDRRATLLAWNRGTRSFIRQLIQADFRRNLNLDAEELRLEFCRMALWNPNELTTQSGNEWLEIQILQHARQALNNGNSGQCRNLCNRLLQENWRSVFVDCTVQLMMFALDKNMTEGWSDRLAELQNMMGRLDSLRAGAPVYWKDEVLALQTEAAGLIAQPPGIPMQLNFPQQGYTVQGEQEDMNMASPISNSLTESVEE